MAVNNNMGSKPPSNSVIASEPLYVPRTPLESRQGYHPKSDGYLKWKTPPSRQLSLRKRVEYESDVRERFYDDYIGDRSVGDAGNEVLTTSEAAKLKFDPSLYRVNAYQGLAYDPMRPVPAGLDFNVVLQQEKMREKQHLVRNHRQRQLSEPINMGSRTANYYSKEHQPAPCQHLAKSGFLNLPPIRQQPPRSLQKSLNEVISLDAAPSVKKWFLSASKKDQEVAADFFRTLSSHGKKPDPASKASVHRSRVRSAVMTPARNQMSRDATAMEKQGKHVRKAEPPARHGHLRRSSSKGWTAKDSSVLTSMKRMSPHFNIHPAEPQRPLDTLK